MANTNVVFVSSQQLKMNFSHGRHKFFLETEENTENKKSSRDMLNIMKLFINYNSMAANTCRVGLLIHYFNVRYLIEGWNNHEFKKNIITIDIILIHSRVKENVCVGNGSKNEQRE